MGNNGEINMSVSGICRGKDGKQKAYVNFSDEVRSAEGEIPACKITSNKGFAAIEVEQLEKYMSEHLEELKQMSANVNVVNAFLDK
ncbi:MAG: hypothetical protein K6B67_02655 [Lachnospiraceae bacterium]|nr:hypothetical protein [Lachnospiraceae bacterium]